MDLLCICSKSSCRITKSRVFNWWMLVIMFVCVVYILIGTQIPRRAASNWSDSMSEMFLYPLGYANNMDISPRVNNNKNRSSIILSRIDNLYLDMDKAVVFYAGGHGDDVLVLTFLVQAKRMSEQSAFRVNLRVNRDGVRIFDAPVDVFNRRIMSSRHYVFSLIETSIAGLCSWPCETRPISESTKLTYQLTVNGQVAPECDINIVNTTALHAEQSKLTARLIKCMWMPDDVETFKYIMSLIIESKYDSIYVCVFREDHELKSLLAEFDSRQKINIIELESVPHVHPGREDLRSRKQMNNDESIDEKGSFMDPALEYLLNQMYPFLVEKYRYVQAADYDHILFTRNLTFYDRIDEIVRTNNVSSISSLYFDQYWALDNQMSRKIFQSVYSLFNATSYAQLVTSHESMLHKEVFIPLNDLSFELRINGPNEWNHTLSLIDCLESRSRSNLTSPMFRHVVVKFAHPYVYGQTVHDTRASKIVKLCEPGGFFPGGEEKKLNRPHFVHYRDTYNFNIIKIQQRYISVVDFVCWPQFQDQEF